MRANVRLRRVLIGLTVVFFVFVLLDSMGVFNTKPYTEVPHGNHTHYVPKDRLPGVSIDAFPTVKPGPDQRISPTGQIVPAGD